MWFPHKQFASRILLSEAVSLAAAVLLALAGCTSSNGFSRDPPPRGAASEQAFEENPNLPPSPRTLYTMARLFASQGKDAQAEATLVRIVNEYPAFAPAYSDLAELHVRHRRFDSAVQVLSRGLAVAPQDPVLHNNLGMCWVLKGDYAKALGPFTAAAGVMPHDARYRANMAMALGLQGRYDESLALYRQVLPEAEAHHNLSILCEARGDRARASREAALAGQLGGPGR